MNSINRIEPSIVRSQLHSKLSHVNNFRFVLKLITLAGVVTLGAYLCLNGNWGYRSFGVILLGAMFTHMVELQHQCLHYTAFSSRNLNRIVGFFLGIPMLVGYEHYRRQHMYHHRNCGTPDDKEFFHNNQARTASTRVSFVASLFSTERLGLALKHIVSSWHSCESRSIHFGRNCGSIAIEYRLMSAFLVIFVAVAFSVSRPELILIMWILPVLLISEPLHILIEFPEHFGCEASSTNPLTNTRTIRGSRLSFWFTNGNNFHVEHHLLPSAPIDQLPAIHGQISSSLAYVNPSYFDFFRNTFSNGAQFTSPSEAKVVIQ